MSRRSMTRHGVPKTNVENPWAESAETILRLLETSRHEGLSTGEAQRRLRVHGLNQLRQTRPRSNWRILRDQFANLIVALLAVAAAAAFAFEERAEGLAIVAVIFINAAIGFVTERRALRSMEALRKLGHSQARVRRDGLVVSLPMSQLVPGDLVLLDAGDVLTADVRICSDSRFEVDESPLTGESMPVPKSCEPVSADAALSDRSCLLYKGTAVTRGSGEGIVLATGMATELGKISALVDESEPVATPLEKHLEHLGRRLIGFTLGIAALVSTVVVASGRETLLAVEIGIALAVATIPEGLPIVATVALARGMWRMARRNALVEQLEAVETLGATTIILSDKTGTLTENRMTAVELRLAEGTIRIHGTGLDTKGGFELDGEPLVVSEFPPLLEALRTAVLCNNATLEESSNGSQTISGDPTEIALLVAGAKAAIVRDQLEKTWPRISEFAFDPDNKWMATLHEYAGGILAAIKGAPETLIERCTSVRTPKGNEALGEENRNTWLRSADEMAGTGERVLALATAHPESAAAYRFDGLTLLGLVGFFDPPRASVRPAIEACQDAGIRIVMVTGDHGATAWTIALAVGLIDSETGAKPEFVDARALPEISKLTDAETRALLDVAVVARATPRQKLELIELHQRNGEIVAMTGDGVNDAPALKKADIGVAMGKRGTQVAREAADMVLQDDEFGTIVSAIGEGRAIFANIRKFVVYLMSCNVSEILAVALGVLAQGPLPILPLQILFLNLVTDVFPALALGVGEGSRTLMRERPRDPREPILGRRHWLDIFALGAVMALSVLGALVVCVFVLSFPGPQATTVAFLTLAMSQLWHVFTMRDPKAGWVRNEVTRNPWIWGALCLCLILLLSAVYWPTLASTLSIVDPGPDGWAVAFVASLVPLLFGQVSLLPIFHADPGKRRVKLEASAAGTKA